MMAYEVIGQWLLLCSFKPAVVVRLPLGTCYFGFLFCTCYFGFLFCIFFPFIYHKRASGRLLFCFFNYFMDCFFFHFYHKRMYGWRLRPFFFSFNCRHTLQREKWAKPRRMLKRINNDFFVRLYIGGVFPMQ